jgi:hypothetical protein
MAEKHKLVCDRCGCEITGQRDMEAVLAGSEAWQNAARARGEEPRGVFPCKNYVRCHGHMLVVKK